MKLCQACRAVKVFSLPAGPLKLLCLRGRESFFFACEAVRVFFACGAVKVFFAYGVVKVFFACGAVKVFFACVAVKVSLLAGLLQKVFLCLRGR